MIDRFYAQMQAMQMLSKAQDVTADNLANINTPGFKGGTIFYRLLQDNVDENTDATGTPLTEAMQRINLEQGILEPTGNLFDFGISGEGFFVVEEEGQTFLTRDGRFRMDSDGYLVNSRGAKVQGNAGDIRIQSYFQANGQDGHEPVLEVAKDGTIRVNERAHDQIQIVNISDPEKLERRGHAYFSIDEEFIKSDGEKGVMMQGYYEKGNVDPMNEMVDMMKTMQMFESQQKAMQSSDETLSQAINSLGRF
ncbi:MAG: flagellar hook basal-body protein [Balneolaceae bacterium]